MSKVLYTYAERQGARLFVREAYKEDNGVVVNVKKVVDEYPFELFLPASRNATPDSTSLYGDPLSRLEFTSVREFNDFKESNKGLGFHGMEDPLAQYLARQYPTELHADLSFLAILNLDIEVEHSQGFPDQHKAEQEILSISMKWFGQNCFTLGTKKSKAKGYLLCSDEAHLLETFFELYERQYPDIITGWNVEMFDIVYMVNRVDKVLGSGTSKRFSPFAKQSRRPITEHDSFLGEKYYKILGVTVVDYLELYKKFAPAKQESYKLDYIANVELGEGKIDFSEYGGSLMRLYHEAYEKFVEYNIRDVDLVERLDNKLQFIQLLMTVTYMVKGRVEDSQATVKPWDTLLYNMLLAEGKQPPPHPEPDRRKLVGGYVKEPAPGLKKWVVTLDLASLYPNIARTLNMSPETIAVRGEPIIHEILNGLPFEHEEGLAIAANGSQYRQDKEGIIPKAMSFLLERRATVRSEMKVIKKLEQVARGAGDLVTAEAHAATVSRLNALQLALKILANGGYGAIANRYFRYFDIDIAEGITMTGQAVIQFIAFHLSAKMDELLGTEGVDYVIGSDTDSCMTSIEGFMDGYIAACGMPEDYNELIDVADQFVQVNLEDGVLVPRFAELAAMLGSAKSTLSMKREAIADRGLFRAKKHYVLQVWDNEGVRYAKPDMKMVGIETARTTTPKMCKGFIEEALKIILNGTEQELVSAYKGWKKEFLEASPEAIAFPRGVSEINKWVEGGRAIKGTPVQAKAAIAYNDALKRAGLVESETIREGNKLKFLYLRPHNPTGYNVIGLIDKLPTEFGLDQWIDRNLQLEKALLTPIESFTGLVEWNVRAPRVSLGASLFTEEFDANQPVAAKAPVKPHRVTEPRERATVRAYSKKATKPTLDTLF